MGAYRLKKNEKQLLSFVAEPYEVGKIRFTKPIIIAYDNGVVAGVSSLRHWREMLQTLPNFKIDYRFELHNVWQ